jgi:hypothetical protein
VCDPMRVWTACEDIPVNTSVLVCEREDEHVLVSTVLRYAKEQSEKGCRF